MKKYILIPLFLVVCFYAFGQEHQAIKKSNKTRKLRTQTPIVLEPGVTANIFKYVSFNPVRIIYDKEKNVLYMPNQEGDIYQLSIQSNGYPGTESLLISRNEHNINSLQGLEYHDNTFYLVGNQNFASSYNGRGVVMKCSIQGSVKTWNTIAITELYPSSGTLYDHAFAGVSLSKNKDSIYVSSGSRTDHGEVKNSGSYTGLREVPLTAKIFVFPTNASNIYLYNDLNYLKNNGYIYADGTRNEFDMAINGNGHLIGVENSGDRDDPEELNWLQNGKHYGFPWRMGGNDTPMQYAGYNASQDKLVPLDALNRGIFYDDPSFPQRPLNTTFVEPILNNGTNANWIRDPNTGQMYQGAISSFTSHRSPLGLVFDNDSTMAYPYNGNGFVFGYSHSADPFSNYLPTEDGGGDMTFLDLQFDASINNYRLNTKKIISGLGNITDATLDGNIIYISVLQGVVWKIEMPKQTAPIVNFSYTNDIKCAGKINFIGLANNSSSYLWNFGDGNSSTLKDVSHTYNSDGIFSVNFKAFNSNGVAELTKSVIVNTSLIHNSNVSSGVYGAVSRIESNQNLPSNVSYQAGKSITLNPGFASQTGNTFKAEIRNCN